jgi:hypothetical protein
MRTLLTIKKEGRLIYQDYSKSFTRHMMEALYLSHANILTAAPLASVVDVIGATRSVDGDSKGAVTPTYTPKGNMLIDAPSGNGGVLVLSGQVISAGGEQQFNRTQRLAGHMFGIVIGTDNTPATPADARLGARIYHGTSGTVAASSQDSFLADTNDDNTQTTNAVLGFIYHPKKSFLLTRIDLKVFRTGAAPGNVTLNVCGLNMATSITATMDINVLSTSNVVNANAWGAASPGDWVTFTFATPYVLQTGFSYYIYISPSQAAAGNYVNLRNANSNLTTSLPVKGSTTLVPPANLTINTQIRHVYDMWGTVAPEMEYSGTSIYGLTIANPNGSLSIARIFRNNSGEAIGVQESGIYMPLTRYFATSVNYGFLIYSVCAARDVIAPVVNVANGESIEVIYTPGITV